MGSGVWSVNTYQARASQRQASGQDVFAYSQGASGVHPTLNPYGLEFRESRDSDEHPASNSIIVGLDVSGSMGRVVRAIHGNLPTLLGLLLGHTYVPHPQIMFAAFSNGTCDAVPLQVGQFESDNRMDQNLENMILGGRLAGGCDIRESAELLLYTAARHTSIDCLEKRQRKGYLFLITDEMAYETVKGDELTRIFGRQISDIPLDTIMKETQERYHVYVIIPTLAQGGQDTRMIEFWKSNADPQHVLLLENPDDVSHAIALTIGLTEGNITLEEGMEHLREDDVPAERVRALGQVLSIVGKGAVTGSSGGLVDPKDNERRGTRRL